MTNPALVTMGAVAALAVVSAARSGSPAGDGSTLPLEHLQQSGSGNVNSTESLLAALRQARKDAMNKEYANISQDLYRFRRAWDRDDSVAKGLASIISMADDASYDFVPRQAVVDAIGTLIKTIEQRRGSAARRKSYPPEGLAYIDSMAGLIPCRIIEVLPGDKEARVKITAARPGYRRGHEATFSMNWLIPRGAVRQRSGRVRIQPFLWKLAK